MRPGYLVLVFLTAFFLNTKCYAQGLGGPSSVQADLEPGDGLTDPQFRSNFPRNITPGYFAWKDRLAQDHGFKFNFDYLALGQSSNADLGSGKASGRIARFYGSWQATENGSLTFKIENRHAYGAVPLSPSVLTVAHCQSPVQRSMTMAQY
jgi:porin